MSLLAGSALSIGCTTRRHVIAIVPFTGIRPAQVQQVEKAIAELYQVPVAIRPASKVPATAICPVRQRYRARAILTFLASHIASPDDAQAKILALTVDDIEIEEPPQKPHWGVMGLATEIGGSQCVASTFRLRGRADRLVKVSLHEVGHMLHLPHCTANIPACLMNDAQGKAATVDTEQLFLCAQCKSSLRW